MTETQQRFLRAIATRVPMGQIVELHLFPPIRQGGVETGVAVVAEDPRVIVPNVAPDAEFVDADAVIAFDAGSEPIAASGEEAVIVEDIDVVIEDESEVVVEDENESVVTAPMAYDPGDDDDAELDEDEEDEDDEDEDDEDDEDDADEDDDEDHDVDDADFEADLDAGPEADPVASNGASRPPRPAHGSRYTIHTARYRLTLKGVDRGKWEVDVVAEADAPLDALDAVVRGVQRRSGEGAEPDRLSADAFREALDAPLATLER